MVGPSRASISSGLRAARVKLAGSLFAPGLVGKSTVVARVNGLCRGTSMSAPCDSSVFQVCFYGLLFCFVGFDLEILS